MSTIRSNITIRLGLITLSVDVQSAVSEDKEAKLSIVCTGGLPLLDGHPHIDAKELRDLVKAATDLAELQAQVDEGKPVLNEKGEPVLAVHDPVKIKQPTICPSCDRQGNIYSFPRGKDNGDNTFAVLTSEQVEAAYAEGVPQDMKDNIALTAHPAAEVELQTLPGEKTYYLAPGRSAGEIYPMMVALVKSHPEVAFCSVFAVKGAPSMYRLAVFNDRLALRGIAWPDRLNAAPGLRTTEFPPELLAQAAAYIPQVTMPFDPATYRDKRAVVLSQFLGEAERLAAGATPEAAAPAESSLLAALRLATTPVEPVKVPKPRAPRKAPVKTATVTNIKGRKTA